MKEIPVNPDLIAIIDDDDFNLISSMTWHVQKGVNTVYAGTNIPKQGGGYSTALMHRIINKTPIGVVTDHIDGNGLNNRKVNLRDATRIQNGRNRAPNRVGTSKFKGVYWDKQKGRWRSSIRINKRLHHIGLFRDELAASQAYEARAKIEWGEFYPDKLEITA